MKNFFILLFLSLHASSLAQERINRYEIEAGITNTQNMSIHGYRQDNATSKWKKSGPNFRLEYWSTKEKSWNYGFVFQPLSFRYSGVLTSNLQYKGKMYQAGDSATLHYQFPTIRWSANYPLFQSSEATSYIRAGASAIVRYAQVDLATNTNSFTTTHLMAIPVLHLETNADLGNQYGFFTRSDFLPGIDGNVFLDGLFDVFLGIRKTLHEFDTLGSGMRLFFGGYDPKKQENFANRIFFYSFVIRYSW